MRQAFIKGAALTARLWLAIFFASHAIEDMVPGLFGAPSVDVGSANHLLDMLAAVFFALVALWLALGIYSRIIAVIGMVVMATEIILFGHSLLQPSLGLAGLATLVIGVTGGGPLRLYAGGWRLCDSL